MNTLLLVGIGPMQEFIERSRRMRDLWFGSHVFSQMSAAIARSLAEESGWRLIFPALKSGDPDLQLCLGMWNDDTGDRPLAIVNKVLAIRGDTIDETLLEHVRQARQSAIDVWRQFAAGARARAGSLLRDDLLFLHQPENVVDDLLELVAAWTHYDGDANYGKALQETQQRLASRKLLRDFTAWPGAARPKSSLDGFRETVLVEDRSKKELQSVIQSLRLGNQEQLDGVGLVKRGGGNPRQFVPIARIALAPWIGALVERERTRVSLKQPDDRLSRAWKALVDGCERFNVPKCELRSAAWMPPMFPYDGEIFLEGQWANLTFRSHPKDDQQTGLTFGREYVRPVLNALPGQGAGPHPYVACLAADGDRMGDAISKLESPDEHVQFSTRLAEFARGARTIVEQHFGVLIYSGGDDVLAFMPVHLAIGCAKKLHESFRDRMAGAFRPGVPVPTLSVGIGIGHVLSPMGELLALGRDAERLAKYGDDLPEEHTRDALAVIAEKRGGAQDRWRGRWNQTPGPVEQLETLQKLLAERRMPGKLPEEIRDLLNHFPDRTDREVETSRSWAGYLAREIDVILRKKREDGLDARLDGRTPKSLTLEAIDLALDRDEQYGTLAERVTRWIDRARVAKALADSQQAVERISTAKVMR